MKAIIPSLTYGMRAARLATLLLPALALPACGDVADGLSASTIENALCRDARCDDTPSKDAPGDDDRDDDRDITHSPIDDGDAGTASACQSDTDCAAGYECEYEHGVSYCKPHGGHDDEREDHDVPTPDAGTGSGTACYDDVDCAADDRCESIGGGQRACSSDHDEDRSGPNRGRH